MKDCVNTALERFMLEDVGQIVVCGESFECRAFQRVGAGGLLALEAENIPAEGGKVVGEKDAESSRGKIRDPTRAVDGFVAWAAGDDDSHCLRNILS